jgi:hypothetical protein
MKDMEELRELWAQKVISMNTHDHNFNLEQELAPIQPLLH